MTISASKAKAVVVGVVVADDDEQNGDFDDAGDSEDDVDIKAITTIISTTITINCFARKPATYTAVCNLSSSINTNVPNNNTRVSNTNNMVTNNKGSGLELYVTSYDRY